MAQNVSHTSVAKAIYGLITVLPVLLVMYDHPPSAWVGAGILFGTTLTVALVETYAETIAVMLHRQRRLTNAEKREIWHYAAPVMVGAQAPTIVLVLSAVGFFPVEQAITIAQAVLFLFLFGYGVRVGQILHEGWHRQFLSGLVVVAIAALLVAIKIVQLVLH
jgi:hemolysin III